jgi:hypothetical protein
MFVASAEDIRNSIAAILDESASDRPICLAVAFWGDGAETLLPTGRRYRIICNLSTGGTNPSTIRRLMMYPHTEVRNLPWLHAKVVIGQHSCLLGSANFSSSALGFNKPATWREANLVLTRLDERFVHIQQWFWEQWTDSALISENDLRNAEQKWALRTDFLANHDDTSSAEPHAAKSMYALSEEDLFKPTITGENQIRMASRAMEAMFRKLEPNADKTMIRVPAFVSSILWTYYGRPIATAIEDRQYFQIPAHVWERALESRQPKYNEAKIQRFLSFLSTHAEASPAIRFWAKQYIEAGCPGAP